MTRNRWVVLAALIACNCETGPRSSAGPEAPSSNVNEADVLQRNMRAHHDAAGSMQRAITHGRLIDARSAAAWIAANASPRTDELLTAAFEISKARDVKSAAAHTGDLAAACGSCHEELGVRPILKIPPEPPAVPGMPAQMQRHQWAAERLWDGVIGPNDAAWFAGARVMADVSIDLGATTHAKPNEEVAKLAERMGELASLARNTTDDTERSVLYGEMLHTCASCHAIVRPRTIADSK